MSSTNSDGQGFTSAEEYQMLLESFAQAFWESDAQGLAVTDSLSWRAYTGQSLEAWLGEGWASAVHPDDQAYALSQWQEAARQLQPVNAEFRLQRPGGGWRWTNVRATPILNDDGTVKKWLGINIDIQDKKEIEAALQQTQQAYQRELEEQVAEQTRELEESRALLQSTLDSTLNMIQVFKAVRNQEGEIVDFVWTLNNQSSKRQYGDVIGKSLLTLNPGVKEVGIFDTFKQVCETGTPDQSERHYVHEQFDGWFDQSTVKLGDGVATTTTDITRRKKAEQELKDQTYFITSVTEMMPDVVSVVELPARKIIYANRDTMSWLDFNPEEITSLSFEDRIKLFHPDDLPAIQDFYERFSSLQDRQENKVEYRLKNKKGEWVLLSLRGQVFSRDEQGNATQLLLVGQNITAQRRAEEEILRLKDEIAQKATNKYEALFKAIDEGFSLLELIFDEQGKVIDYWHREDNPAFTRMTGIQDPVNRRMSELVPNLEPEWHQMLEEVYYTGQSIRTEYPVQSLGQWYSCYLSPIGQSGSPFIACVYDDITERKRMQERQAYLLSLSDALRQLSDPLAIQQESLCLLCAQLKVPRAIYAEARDQEGTMLITAEQVEAGFLPMKGEIVHFSDLAPEAPTEALLGRPLWREDVFSEEHSPARQAGYAAFQTRSWVMIPLVKQGRLVAELTVHHSEPHAWTAEEISLIEQTTDRTWAAVERAKAEEALQESEKRLRLTIEATQLATWEWNLETNEVYWNEQHFRLFGLEPQPNPVPPEKFFQYVHPREQQRIKGLLERTITEREIYNTEFCAVPKDGSHRWMSGYGNITEERDGQPIRMSGVMFDVDERRRAQDALRESEERLQKAMGIQTVGIVFYDAQGILTQANDAFLSLSGFTRQALKKRQINTDDMTLPEWLDRTQQALTELKTDGRSIPYEKELLRPDGSRWWGLFAATRLSEEEFVEFVIDITGQRRAQQALHQSESRLRAILESAKDYAIYTIDLNRQVTSWNRGAKALFGYSESEIMHQLGDRLYTLEDREQGIPAYEAKKAIREGEAENERWHIRRDGSLFYGSGVVTPLRNETGTIVGLLKVMRDLTAQKRAEEGLKVADRRKDEFLAMLAHELRNPMSTISSGLQILSLTQGDNQTSTGAKVAATVTMMNRQTEHLVRLVDDLLDVSRISQGKIELRMERLDLVELTRLTADTMQVLYHQQGRSLQVDLPAATVYVNGDVARLTQVVTNLLTNGLRYTDGKGSVWLSLEHTGGEAMLQVRDNGIGLAGDQLKSIFELFVQVDNSLARSRGGLGIGLTLVMRLVEMHGGRVEAQSEGLGQGSTFRVYLPTLNTFQAAPLTEGEFPTTSLRLLIVDDNSDVTLTLGMLLELRGYQVSTCNSGQEGIVVAERMQPDVILLDIGMPEMDGYETCRQMREQPWGKDLFIIAVSGYGQQADKQKAKEAGFDEHLTKPVDIEALIQVLSQLP